MSKISRFTQSIVVSILTTAAAIPSQAAERAFRINRDNISANGYAIAWGVKDKPVDFEAIEQAGTDAVSTFLAENFDQMENYIVDIETNSVISKLTSAGEPTISGHLGGLHIGNHFSYQISDVAVNGLNPKDGEELVAFGVLTSFKWWTGLSSIEIVSRKSGKVTVVSTTTQLEESIEKQARALLPAASRLKFDQMSFHFGLGKNTTTRAGTNVMEYTLNGQVPKTDATMTVTGLIGFKLVGKKVVAKVISAKEKK